MSKVRPRPAPAERILLIISPPVRELLSLEASRLSSFIHRARLIGLRSSLSGNIGVLLLCEVAVKPWLDLTDSRHDAGEHVKKAKKLYDHSLPFVPFTSTHRPCVGPLRE